MIIRTIYTLLIAYMLSSCSTQPEYTVVSDALNAINTESTFDVPDDAYDALTPDMENAPSRFDVVASRNTANEFFNGLVDGMGINILVHPDIKSRISLNLKNVTLEETLQAIRDSYGLQYIKTPYGYRILPNALQNKVFHVNYLNVLTQWIIWHVGV